MTIQSQSVRTFFTGFSVATTGYIYNSSNGNNATTGWVDCKADKRLIQINCATKTVGGVVQYRIEGKVNTLDRPASITVGEFSKSGNIDRLVEVSELCNEIRVGVRLSSMVASPLASQNNMYTGLILTDFN